MTKDDVLRTLGAEYCYGESGADRGHWMFPDGDGPKVYVGSRAISMWALEQVAKRGWSAITIIHDETGCVAELTRNANETVHGEAPMAPEAILVAIGEALSK